MPRLPRVHLKDVIYFVTLDGPQHESIFRDPADYQKYLELLGKYKQEYQFKLFSYALLPSRLHLLLETNDQYPISQVMQKITPLYTKYYNGKYDRKGPLFPKRFRSVVVEKEPYMTRLTRFLHLIPVRAGLVQNFREYFYTSYAAFAGNAGRSLPPTIDLSQEVQEVLRDFPGDGIENSYERFVVGVDPDEIESFNKKLFRGAFLGSDDFVNEVKKRMEEQMKIGPVMTEPALTAAPRLMQRRILALSGTLMLSVIVSTYSVYLNLNAQFQSARAGAAPMVVYREIVRSSGASEAIAGARIIDLLPIKQNVKSQTPITDESLRFNIGKENVNKNVAPAARPDLNGTIWDVELVSVSESGEKTSIKDKIKFNGKSFESHYFKNHGFSSPNYTVTIQNNGIVTWETIQKNFEGEMVSWRGDWQGSKMEGMLSYHSAGNSPRDFSFMSQGVTQ